MSSTKCIDNKGEQSQGLVSKGIDFLSSDFRSERSLSIDFNSNFENSEKKLKSFSFRKESSISLRDDPNYGLLLKSRLNMAAKKSVRVEGRLSIVSEVNFIFSNFSEKIAFRFRKSIDLGA